MCLANQICQSCGKVFDGRKRKYCGGPCRRGAARKIYVNKHPTIHAEVPCQHCGKRFMARQYQKSGKNKRFCSAKCRQWSLSHPCPGCGVVVRADSAMCKSCSVKDRGVKSRVCLGCGVTYRPKSSQRAGYCTRECAFRHYRSPVRTKPASRAHADGWLWCLIGRRLLCECVECGVWFVGNKVTKTCSPECRKQRFNASMRHHAAKRASRSMGGRKIPAGWHASVSRLTTFERDGYMCGICGAPTKRHWVDARKERLAPVLDHIEAVTHGGKHEYGNVQCAHRICNRAKLDGSLDEAQRAIKLALWITGCETVPEMVVVYG